MYRKSRNFLFFSLSCFPLPFVPISEVSGLAGMLSNWEKHVISGKMYIKFIFVHFIRLSELS